MSILLEGSYPDERPIQRVLPGFENLVIEQFVDLEESTHDDTEVDEPQPPDKTQLILPGFEEFMLESGD